MNETELRNLETCLNEINMDDTHDGYRPSISIAQLYFEQNNITNEQLLAVEAGLDQLVLRHEIDRGTVEGKDCYRSQKFGSRHEEYIEILSDRAHQAEIIEDNRQRLIANWTNQDTSFLQRDDAWYADAYI